MNIMFNIMFNIMINIMIQNTPPQNTSANKLVNKIYIKRNQYNSTSSKYTALIQTGLATLPGYKLFAFTFSSSSSAPSFVWGFNSFYKMGFDDGYSIIFAST